MQMGENPKIVCERLSHSRVQTLLVFTHIQMKQKKAQTLDTLRFEPSHLYDPNWT